jgi:hypothetical protein
MTSPLRRNLDEISTKLAVHLRAREANVMRGQPERLNQLEMTTDRDLLRKFLWSTAIISAGCTFFALPLLMMVLKSFLPEVLTHVLWVLIKIGMATSCAVFALAAYLTFWSNDAG